MDKLDRHEIDILRFIERYQNRNSGISPSYKEIGQAIGVLSKDHVSRDLRKLVRLGYLLIQRGKARAIILLRTADGYRVAMGNYRIPVWGFISAGDPIPLPDQASEPMDWIDVPRSTIMDSAGVFGVRVKGDSMIDALVNDGDTVLIRQQQTAANGDLVAARLTIDPTHPLTTFKRFYREGNDIELKPENPQLDSIPVDACQIEIQGIVVHVSRDASRNDSSKLLDIR
jgi:repressor LexA